MSTRAFRKWQKQYPMPKGDPLRLSAAELKYHNKEKKKKRKKKPVFTTEGGGSFYTLVRPKYYE